MIDPGLIERAIHGDTHAMRLLFENLHSNVSALNETVGIVGANTDSQTPKNPIPARALLEVLPSAPGFVQAAITNPQFLRSTVPAQKKGNLARSPMVHVVSYSPDPNFKNNVTTLPPGVQTHYQLPTGGQKLYVRWKSSADGVNYNAPAQTGPHSG